MNEVAPAGDTAEAQADSAAPKRSLWPRRIAVTVIPLVAQFAALSFVFVWAEGRGSGRGMMALGLMLVMAVAIPVTLVANLWIVRETRHWNALLVVAIAILQAVIVPVGIIVAFVIG